MTSCSIFRLVAVCVLFCSVFPQIASCATVKTIKKSSSWELHVDGKPYFIKGMCYYPDTIGESPHNNTRRHWLMVDDDNNGRNDFAYQTWVDTNRNNVRDADEPEIGDFALMKQMGVNTIRVYHHLSEDPQLQQLNQAASKGINGPIAIEKKMLNELYTKFGIMVAMGDFLGAYTISTGASWEKGTDYTDPKQKAYMLKSIEEMVRAHKDELYVLMWILGNENNLPYPHTQASQNPKAYAKFVNEAAKLIKKIDKGRHPVALCNGGDGLIEYYAKYAPQIDIFGMNMYQFSGFHEVWRKVDAKLNKPIIFTEFGTANPVVKDGKLNEKVQALVHQNLWTDIKMHGAGGKNPQNALGGFVFEWADNWWEDGAPLVQNINPDGSNWNHEYNGMFSFGDGTAGSLMRQPRLVYETYQRMWKAERS